MAFSKNRRLAQIISDTSGNLAVQGITVPTQSASDNDTSAASTAYVTTAVSGLIDSAPDTLNTLNEIAAALNDDANFNTTVTNSIASKLPLAGGTLTGALTTNGVINTGTSHNFAINTPNSLRINIDSNDSGTSEKFIIGHNQTAVDTSNDLMVILESGNVGIGTSSPDKALHVVSASNQIRIEDSTNNKKYDLNVDSSNFMIDDMVAGVNRFTIADGGHVGIGTSSPGAALEVNYTAASITDATGLLIKNASGSQGNRHTIAMQSGSGIDVGVGFYAETTAKWSLMYDNAEAGLHIYDEVNGAKVLTARAGGNVGIGTNDPDVDLHIQRTNTSPSYNYATRYVAAFERNGACDVAIRGANDGSSALSFSDEDDADVGRILYDHSNNSMDFYTNASERMMIDSSGNVGIGDTSPDKKLHITDTSGNHLRIAYDDSYYWDIGRQAADGRLSFTNVGGTEALSIKTTGKVGIGTDSPSDKLEISGTGGTRLKITNTDTNWGALDIEAGGNQSNYVFFRDDSAERARIQVLDNNDIAIGNGSSTTERMRLNSSGHLLVGTTSDAALDGVSPGICVGSTSSTTSGIAFSSDNHEWLIYNASDGKLRFYDSTDNTEFAYVDTSRRFTFGGNFAHSTYGHVAVFGENSVPNGVVVMEDFDVSSGIGNTILNLYFRDEDPATHAVYIDFRDGGGRVGSVTHNDDGGGVTYNTTSDYRLKENVDYNWDGTTLLKQLKPAKFNFIGKTDKTRQGFLAHEVMDIVPGSVRGTKDQMEPVGTIKDSDGNVVDEGVYEHFCKTDEGQTWTQTGTEPYYQELDYSRLVPLLVKTIQELEARIATLEE